MTSISFPTQRWLLASRSGLGERDDGVIIKGPIDAHPRRMLTSYGAVVG